MAQRKNKSGKPKKSSGGVAKGREVIPVQKEKETKKPKEQEERSIPIGIPVSKEKFDELKKKSKKKD
jgi:hypothetical protein